MSDTPRADASYFRKGVTLYDLAGDMKTMERELAAANERLGRAKELVECALTDDDVVGRFYDQFELILDVLDGCEGEAKTKVSALGDMRILKGEVAAIVTELHQANERIRRLEEAGDAMARTLRAVAFMDKVESADSNRWTKAKEARP